MAKKAVRMTAGKSAEQNRRKIRQISKFSFRFPDFYHFLFLLQEHWTAGEQRAGPPGGGGGGAG